MRFRRVILLLPFVPALCGCAPPPAQVEKIDPEVWKSPHAVPVQHATSVAVAEGTLPLVYETAQHGFMRVTDEQTGKQVIRAEANADQIVAVDAERGVSIAGKSLTGGLPADHRYLIFVDIIKPEAGPTPAPAESGKK